MSIGRLYKEWILFLCNVEICGGAEKTAQKFRAVCEGFSTKGEKVPARYYAPVLFVLK